VPRPQGSTAQGSRQEQGRQQQPRLPQWLMRSGRGEDGLWILENQELGRWTR
jgi:hypothetical protein